MHDKCFFLSRIADISNDFSFINFIKLSRERDLSLQIALK